MPTKYQNPGRMEFTAEIRVKQAETRLRRILKAVAELKGKKKTA
jgi:hypothetical protein